MKTTLRQLLFSTALACLGPLSLAVLAESAPPPVADKADATATPAPVAATATTTTATPAETAAAAPAPSAPAPTASTSAESAPAPSTAASSTAGAVASESTSTASTESSMRRLDQPSEPPRQPEPPRQNRRVRGDRDNAEVGIGHDVTLPADAIADGVVAIFGSATADGEVRQAVVSIGGDTRANGRVGQAAVAILGSTYVNNRVGDAAVAILGDVDLGPKANVNQVVCIGGVVHRDPQAIIRGQTVNVSLFGGHIPQLAQGARAWLTHCLLLGRPLAFGEHLGWAWLIAGGFLVLYLLIALVFGHGVDRCIETLITRPGFSVLAAFLTVLLVPIAITILVATGIGIAVVPFVAIALMCASVFGKTVMLAAIGRPIVRQFGNGFAGRAVVATLIGGIIILLVYTIPFVGFLVMKLLGWIGVGVVVYTLIIVSRRNRPAPAAPAVAGVTPAPAFAGTVPAMAAAAGAAPTAEATIPAPAAPITPVTAATLPRAGFWIRLGALVLDIVMCAILIAVFNMILPHRLHIGIFDGGLLVVIAVYGSVMWKLRGSTIGGIICGLRLVRLDGRPIDWATAIVRALGCFLSLIVAGLGFIWVAFDDSKQSWHDKIAGTTVVSARGAVSLL